MTAKTYDDLKAMIETNENGDMPGRDARYLWITCREASSSWIDDSYVVSAEPVNVDDDDGAYTRAVEHEWLELDADGEPIEAIEVWRVEDPNLTEYYRTREEAVEAMIDLADMYFSAD